MISFTSTKSITGNDYGTPRGTSVGGLNAHICGLTAPGIISTVQQLRLTAKYTVWVRGVIIDASDTHYIDEMKLVSAQSLVELGGMANVNPILDYSLTGNSLVLSVSLPIQVSLTIIVGDVEAARGYTIDTAVSLTRTSLP
jgi:hypothetical protein